MSTKTTETVEYDVLVMFTDDGNTVVELQKNGNIIERQKTRNVQKINKTITYYVSRYFAHVNDTRR